MILVDLIDPLALRLLHLHPTGTPLEANGPLSPSGPVQSLMTTMYGDTQCERTGYGQSRLSSLGHRAKGHSTVFEIRKLNPSTSETVKEHINEAGDDV